MLSTLMKFTSTPNDPNSHSHLANLLMSTWRFEAVSTERSYSLIDIEFDLRLDASFDDNGVVTDLSLAD